MADPEFDFFFRQAYRECVSAARRVLGDLPAAEDAAAEAMVRCLVRWGRVQHLPHRDLWVRRVAINLALDEVRRRGRRRPAIAPPPAAEGEIDVAQQVRFAQALAELPRRQRDALVLRYYLDLSEADAAQALGVATNSLKTHTKRGLSRLRSRTTQQGDEGLWQQS